MSSVTETFRGSNSRSSCDRLVRSSFAIACLVFCCSCMDCDSCQASTLFPNLFRLEKTIEGRASAVSYLAVREGNRGFGVFAHRALYHVRYTRKHQSGRSTRAWQEMSGISRIRAPQNYHIVPPISANNEWRSLCESAKSRNGGGEISPLTLGLKFGLARASNPYLISQIEECRKLCSPNETAHRPAIRPT